MLKAAKVLIKNPDGKYLLLHRNNHPLFGNEIDLPGGTAAKGETIEAAAIREVYEESGVRLSEAQLTLLISTRKYSRVRNQYTLYEAQLDTTPEVTVSWEHLDHVWLTADQIIQEAEGTNDKFLRMVADVLSPTVVANT